MLDIALHVLGALLIQAGFAALGAIGLPAIGLPWRVGFVAGAVIGGAASALLWRAREIRQSRHKASGKVHAVEWVAPAIANVAGLAIAIAISISWR